MFTAFLWGILAIGLKIATKAVPPVTITWFRFVLAFVVLSVYYLIFDRDKLSILKKPSFIAIIAGIALGANYIGFIVGVHLTSPTISQIFIQVGPVMLAVAGVFLFKERFTLRQIFGLILVTGGLLIFYNETLSTIVAEKAGKLKSGIFWLLFAGFTWTIYAILQKKEVKKFDPMQLNLLIFGVPALLLTPAADFNSFTTLNVNQWLLMAYLGLNTFFAYGALAFAFKYTEANKVSVILILNPVITFVVMAYLSHIRVSWIEPETYTLCTIIGAIMALAGVIVIISKNVKSK